MSETEFRSLYHVRDHFQNRHLDVFSINIDACGCLKCLNKTEQSDSESAFADLETEAAKWNSASSVILFQTVLFLL